MFVFIPAPADGAGHEGAHVFSVNHQAVNKEGRVFPVPAASDVADDRIIAGIRDPRSGVALHLFELATQVGWQRRLFGAGPAARHICYGLDRGGPQFLLIHDEQKLVDRYYLAEELKTTR